MKSYPTLVSKNRCAGRGRHWWSVCQVSERDSHLELEHVFPGQPLAFAVEKVLKHFLGLGEAAVLDVVQVARLVRLVKAVLVHGVEIKATNLTQLKANALRHMFGLALIFYKFK